PAVPTRRARDHRRDPVADGQRLRRAGRGPRRLVDRHGQADPAVGGEPPDPRGARAALRRHRRRRQPGGGAGRDRARCPDRAVGRAAPGHPPDAGRPQPSRPLLADAPTLAAMRLLVTGGAGFIGSNYARHVLATSDDEVTVFDALTYAGNLASLRDLEDEARFRFVKGDITDRGAVKEAMIGHDAVLHFAAESHVDRSIVSPDEF